MRVRFADTSATIDVPDCPVFLTALRGAAIDWPFAATEIDGEPIVTVQRAGDKYAVAGPGEEAMEITAVGAACSVVVDLVKRYIEENPARLCFHCGSVLMAGRLVVFPNQYRAGKSALVARLSASGHEVYGDDVLPISDDDEHGISVGIAPRLRVPLPMSASAAFRRYVAEFAGPNDDRYLYLNLPKGMLAPRGTMAPLGAVVLLDRRHGGPASLREAGRGATLRALIVRNFARAAPADALLERLHRLMDRLPRFILQYSDLDEAARLLEATFSGWPPRVGALGRADPGAVPADSQAYEAPHAARTAGARFTQNPTVKLRRVDGELFLTDAGGTGIHHLNAVGVGLWNLLAEPIAEAGAVEVLCQAFPDADRARILRDVGTLFDALAAAEFIEPVPPADCNGRALPS